MRSSGFTRAALSFSFSASTISLLTRSACAGNSATRSKANIVRDDAATSHFHNHEHIQQAESGRYRHQKITRHDGLGVIADKGPPVLRGSSPTPSRITLLGPVRPHRSWRNQDPKLHRQFCTPALLPPGRVLLPHAHNQLAKSFRNPRSSQPRLPPPKQFEPLAMPAD